QLREQRLLACGCRTPPWMVVEATPDPQTHSGVQPPRFKLQSGGPMRFLPSRKPLQRSLPSRRLRRPLLLERLEDRLAPAVHFMALATRLNPDLNSLNTQLATIDSGNALPVVGRPLPQIPSAANLVAGFQGTLFNTLKNSNNTNVKQNLETNLGALLVGPADVAFEGPSVDPTGVTITLHLDQPWQSATPDHTNFGLGLP